MPRIYTQYDPPPADSIDDWGPSKTRQEFREESDVNNIIKQYEQHGILPMERDGIPTYADFTDPVFTNYQLAQNIVVGAREMFMALPAKTRERFNNDPASLIDFVQDPANLMEAEKLGLLRDDYKSPSAPPEPTETKP